jgi:serine/threonine kinase 32
MPCLHAISSLLERDRRKRIGAAGFDTFTSNPFFQPIDFVALERKQIPPVFIPSTEKTNFDATYDLEELLLEEAPLEARARRQKPRAELKDDATDREIREDELHRMVETLFEPFDYTTTSYEGCVNKPVPFPTVTDFAFSTAAAALAEKEVEVPETTSASSNRSQAQSSTTTPSGSPPLHAESMRAAGAANNVEDIPSSDDNKTKENEVSKVKISSSTNSKSFSRPVPPKRVSGASRKVSKGGGIQMVLDEAGSWSGLSDQHATLPADSLDGTGVRDVKGGNSGILGFLSRKKGRDKSPKPQEPGILGKEGARRIIS